MGGIFSAVINQGNVAGIQVQSVQPAVVDGLAYQIFFQAGGEYASIGDGKVWRNLKGSADTYSFFNGLEQSGTNVFNTLVTGLGSAQEINGFNDDIGGAGLRFKAATESLINDNQIEFYGNGSTSTFFHQNNGNWDFGSRLKLNSTSGSHIQSLWQSAAPSGNASQSHFWFDSIGSPSFRIATGNWWKFTPNTLTSNRSYGLQDSNYTIAGIDISQTFTAAQTFQAGATFGAALNAIAGSAATPSINFGTSNTGIFGDSTTVRISVAGTQRMQINNGGNMTVTGNISALQLQTSNGTFLSSPSVPLTNGAGANTGTLTNAPQGGNPTKWIPINDNGNTRYIPCW
jgi:hypothetical protein